MEMLLKLCAIAIVVSVITSVLKKSQPEFSLMLSILATVLVLFYGCREITSVITLFEEIVNRAGLLPEILVPLLKILAIAILTKISVDICKESGCLGLSTVIELMGNGAAILAATPLVGSMLSFLTSI